MSILFKEYGPIQLATTAGLLGIGTTLHAKNVGGKKLALITGAFGAALVVDDMAMIHECLDSLGPRSLYLVLELGVAGLIAWQYLKRKLMPLKYIAFLATVAIAALAIDYSRPERFGRHAEEVVELVCVMSMLLISLRLEGHTTPKNFAVKLMLWLAISTVGIAAFIAVRPHLCPAEHALGVEFFNQSWFFK